MNKLRTFAFTFALVILGSQLHAGQGMWIPFLVDQMNIKDLNEKGFQLDAEAIYSINQASLKDAIVIFGRGCTGELISDKGLLLTNHHCGLGQIQSHSSVENDYISNGFWAKNLEEELPNPDLTVKFLKHTQEITNRVLSDLPDGISYAQRKEELKIHIDSLEKVLSDSSGMLASIESFFSSNQYYLFFYKEYQDVRLVGAPPQSIGNFGKDTDNWVWPRHTGDFSLFRIYAGADGEPAEYNEENIPLKPVKSLTISAQGIQEGDFTMVLGYPGSTNSYLHSSALQRIDEEELPRTIALRDKRLEIMNEHMAKSDKVRIQYASKQSRTSNAWKKWKGIRYGFKRMDVVETRRQYEDKLLEMANSQQKEMLESLYQSYEEVYTELGAYSLAAKYFRESVMAIEMLRLGNRLESIYLDVEKTPADKKEDYQKVLQKFHKDYNQQIDKEIAFAMIKEYRSFMDKELWPSSFEALASDDKLQAYVEKSFKKSSLVNPAKQADVIAKIQTVGLTGLKKDPLVVLYLELSKLYLDEIKWRLDEYRASVDSLNHIYMPLLIEVDAKRSFYPNANFTMRLAYGEVKGYSPLDAKSYHFQTSLDGIIEKSNEGIKDYWIPERLKELHDNKDFGRYESNGTVPVAFVATNHTSGGNSGSPVLNSQGQLIGLNFDRAWDGTMSDYYFHDDICRNISVDIRYVLFIIDKYADCGYLIDEMDIVW